MAGGAWCGETRRDVERTGMAGEARQGRARRGQVRQGKAGMATVHLVRTPGGLKAADDAAVEALRRLAQGEVVRVELRKVRNPQFHRKFFALLQLVRDSTDAWATTEALLADLKVEMGHCDEFRLRNGQTVMIPRSISFGSMDDMEFTSFYERALVTLSDMAGGIESDALRDAVLDEIARA